MAKKEVGPPRAKSLRYRYRELIANALTDGDFEDIISSIAKRAKGGDAQAAKLIFEYAFGKPDTNVNLGDGLQVGSIEFHFSRPTAEDIQAEEDEKKLPDLTDVPMLGRPAS